MSRILLVDSYSGINKFPPIALGKISTYHKLMGDEVVLVKGKTNVDYTLFPEYNFEKAYITTLFTWWFDESVDTIKYYSEFIDDIEVGGISATLLSSEYQRRTGIVTHSGLDTRFDNLIIDYSIFPNEKRTFVVSSRGCINRCKYCSVPSIEPDYIEYDTILNQLREDSKWVIIMDNNFFNNSNWKKILIELKDKKCEIDINQAIDCMLFDDDKAETISSIKIKSQDKGSNQCLKFAYDKDFQLPYIENCFHLIKKYNMAVGIEIYMLYNFNDTPQDFHRKIMNIKCLVDKYERYCVVYPMRFQPLLATRWNSYIGKYWTQDWLKYIRYLTLSSRGFINVNRDSDIFNTRWNGFFDNFQNRVWEKQINFGNLFEF